MTTFFSILGVKWWIEWWKNFLYKLWLYRWYTTQSSFITLLPQLLLLNTLVETWFALWQCIVFSCWSTCGLDSMCWRWSCSRNYCMGWWSGKIGTRLCRMIPEEAAEEIKKERSEHEVKSISCPSNITGAQITLVWWLLKRGAQLEHVILIEGFLSQSQFIWGMQKLFSCSVHAGCRNTNLPCRFLPEIPGS